MKEIDTSPILILLHTVGREGEREGGRSPSSPSHFLSLSNQNPPIPVASFPTPPARSNAKNPARPSPQPTTYFLQKTLAIQVHYHPLPPLTSPSPKDRQHPNCLPPSLPPCPPPPPPFQTQQHARRTPKQNAEKKKNSRPHYDLIVILQKPQFSRTYIHTQCEKFFYIQ